MINTNNTNVRTLQCNKNLSIIDIQNMKDELRVIRSSSSHEPYCKFLSIEEDVTYPEIFGKYYNNCIDLLLHFIQTLESMDDYFFEDEEFISMYHKRLKTNDLLEFSKKSIFYKRDIEYLLQNIPNLKGKQITTSDLMKMVMEIVEIDNKKGSLEALKLTQLAIDVNQPPPPAIFLRLHSKYIFENDHNDIQLALKFAKCAVSACPNSLDHIFFNASLQYQETSMASSNNKIKYWMILFACEKSLMLESVAEADEFTAKIIQLVDKKTNEFKSKMEIILYLKNKLRNLINMCYRSIDDLPTSFLDNITSKTIPPSEKLKLTIEMFENPKYRFCPFLYRVYSELCHTFALQSFDAKDGFGSHWLKSAYISATIADRNFHSSIEYGINHITRNLQVLKNFYIGQAAIISQDLQSIFNNKNYQEPYYKYLISDNEYKDDKQRNGYFVSCATLLEVYAVTLEQEFKDNSNEFSRTNVFYKELKDIGLTDFPKKAPGFFANIRYLLENPPTVRERYHGLLDDEENEDYQPSKEKKDDKNKAKMRKKKNKNASRKK
ncbi:hypothetical protein ZOSMA_389G00010 [Zostera marina]|uniref:Uncharacterized protein n=1 Tax=Zostera marina TaxID=29655 RepID=A0A0K9P4U6_ZOSMR|nr:hypothetical protein ZOSMA_389G00010 [Zostera marina]